jgi:hypothetical protein
VSVIVGEEKADFITGQLVNETILRYGDWGVITTRKYLGILKETLFRDGDWGVITTRKYL